VGTVIEVENLGKKYVIQHLRRERYQTLRDVVVKKVASFGKKQSKTNKEDFWALKDFNLEVKEGEKVAVIGRNGAGKSTLLKLLSRITEPTTGKIILTGQVSGLLEVGTGFHPELTGRENIFLNGAILGMGKAEIEKKFDQIVEFAEISNFLDTPVKRYSSGMHVRLAFAVAAHLEPEILIVDEVLAVGDTQFQKKCLGKMEEVSQGGRTVLFVSHNLVTVQQLCNRLIVLEKGRKVYDGDMENGIAFYLKGIGQQQVFYDVRDLVRRSDLSCEVTFMDVEVLNNNNFLYEVNRPIKIRIHLKGNENVSSFFSRLKLLSAEERVVGTAISDTPLSINLGEEKYFTLTFDTTGIAPGKYSLSLILSKDLCPNNLRERIVDLVRNIFSFEIIPADFLTGQTVFWGSAWGFFQLNKLSIIEEDLL
jgi:lipopolysaccharide transport system ATP-binding protein